MYKAQQKESCCGGMPEVRRQRQEANDFKASLGLDRVS
jgi:hypothetical protein